MTTMFSRRPTPVASYRETQLIQPTVVRSSRDDERLTEMLPGSHRVPI